MVNDGGGARDVIVQKGAGDPSSSSMMNGNDGDAVAGTAVNAGREAEEVGTTRSKVTGTDKPPDIANSDGAAGDATDDAGLATTTSATCNGTSSHTHNQHHQNQHVGTDGRDLGDPSSSSSSLEHVMRENRRLREEVARLEERIRDGGGGGGGGLLSDLKKRLSSPLMTKNGGRKKAPSKHGGGGGGSASSGTTPISTPRQKQNRKRHHGDGEYRRILHPSPDGDSHDDHGDEEEEAELSASYRRSTSLDRKRFLPVGGGDCGDDDDHEDDDETRPLTPSAFEDAEAGDPATAAVAKKLSPMEVSQDDDDGSGNSVILYEVENDHDEDVDPDDVLHEGPFRDVFCDRASWLVGLLVLQSCSSFILERNEKLLQRHLVIVHFLTMLVGAGGNAGNQACVRVIRGLAVGSLNDATLRPFLWTEFKMAMLLSVTLATAGFVRAAVFETPLAEMMAITASLFMIVITSIFIGALLPLVMKAAGIDPAHSCTTIQVMMDIIGVLLTVNVSSVILNTAFGREHSSPPPDESDLCP